MSDPISAAVPGTPREQPHVSSPGSAAEPLIGVLALQGGFREHQLALSRIGVPSLAVRTPAQFARVRGLIIPGGESSVIDKLSRIFGLREPIIAAIKSGMPVFGTCAGLIMLSDRLEGSSPGQQSFGGLNITVQRNAFGAQQLSCERDLLMPALSEQPVRAVFIRAPAVLEVGPEVEILCRVPEGPIVAVRQGSVLGCAFHPELTDDSSIHRFFVDSVHASGFVPAQA